MRKRGIGEIGSGRAGGDRSWEKVFSDVP